jgi:hypothetical protein
LARHDGQLRAGADEPLSLAELLDLLSGADADSQQRHDAIACYLSAGDGWREAVKRLGGAFAEAEAGLRDLKTD